MNPKLRLLCGLLTGLAIGGALIAPPYIYWPRPAQPKIVCVDVIFDSVPPITMLSCSRRPM